MQGKESLRIQVEPEGDSFPLMEIGTCEAEASEQWDYVLVAHYRTQRDPRQVRQQQFLQELERKGFHIKSIQDQKLVFFGIRADNSIFDLYRTLLLEPEGPTPNAELAAPTPVPVATRIRIVDFVVMKTKTSAGETFEDLVKDGVFEARFPLHKGEGYLKKTWAGWRHMFRKQPIDEIRNYFGEKVALYFAWLGWYNYMLVPAALTGLLVFLSGFSLFDASQISKEICEAHDILMCPLGDHSRRYQRLSETCTFAKLTHLFDNDGTVVFAIFMALWATVFLEIWKRQRASVVLHWDLYVWDEDQEEMALELINCPNYKLRPHQHSYLRSAVILILSLIMICLMIGMAHILVVYRVLASALFSSSALLFLEDQVTTAVVVTGALVHYVTISIMTKINKHVALKLCDFEMPRTFSERESKFTIRFFTLQFFTHFSSLIYIAFILGRINGHPGKSTRLAGLWKLEECHASGCMMDLFVQMAIIMGLKQTLSNCGEYLVPWVTHKFRSLRASEARHLPRDPELRDWRRNYLLNSVNIFSLFDEFMEMMIQYGFTTIFVAAFPLAPLLALFSNLVEIRLDAIKMVWLQRRLVPRKAKDIGTWLQVLETIGVLAVIANGMIIAFTSEFIPRVVYKYRYSPCLKEANSTVDCLKGYVNHSLSVFHTKDFQDPDRIEGSENVTLCRYRDYRNPPDYNFSEQFWFLLAIRLAFVILFEHVALCIKLIAAWFVPDVPQSVKNKVLEVKYQRLCEKMWHGRQRLGGVGAGSRPPMPTHPYPASIFSARSTDV
ncbi:anoctamin-9 isoform X2 [Trachypithecus francoisi]|uniref:anoctamin-9 isoform X2 n=1 Tax=Trachypithecus francoisi TaxID=54180 RepID=UPI00141B7BDF|nr:anoctamin-9 isoform X2 [Trachypithecus francoisi]